MSKLITINKQDGVKFCMDNTNKKEYKVIVGNEIFYTHWDFDTAVKEYQLIRKTK